MPTAASRRAGRRWQRTGSWTAMPRRCDFAACLSPFTKTNSIRGSPSRRQMGMRKMTTRRNERRHSLLGLAVFRWLGVTIIAGATRAASGQSTPVTGSDLLPKVVSNKLVTGAHFDPTGEDLENVRVFGWAFQSDSLDPYFIQDPGFNAPAGMGLPSGTAFGFDVLSSLTFWNGSGVPTFGPAPTSESLLYTFGIKSTTIAGSSGVQPGFSIGTVAADGSVHKHLNAFLNGPDGNSDPSDGGLPANGVYSFSFRITDTGAGIAASDPLYAVYGNGASTAAIDRAKFRIRNYNAPGTRLAGTVTNLIGLSPLAGEVNLATGGQV